MGRISAYERGVSGQREDPLVKGGFLKMLQEQVDSLKADELKIVDDMQKELREQPIWVEWLSEVTGCGPVRGSVITTGFDIEIATTVSKMWQFSGLNPGMVRGMKIINKEDYLPKMGTVVRELKDKDKRTGKKKIIVRTYEMVRGDRLTSGFLSPFSGWMRSQMCGKLGPSFLIHRSEYAINYYYPLHVPLERRSELGPGRLDVEENIYEPSGKMWKDESEGHRAQTANRYMIKMFLRDLYCVWRKIEGLPVRPPYEEEYLGKTHNT
jgi:hypothetical protein